MRTLAEDVIPPPIAALSIRDSQRHPTYLWNYKTNKGITLSAWNKVTPWGKNLGTKRKESRGKEFIFSYWDRNARSREEGLPIIQGPHFRINSPPFC